MEQIEVVFEVNGNSNMAHHKSYKIEVYCTSISENRHSFHQRERGKGLKLLSRSFRLSLVSGTPCSVCVSGDWRRRRQEKDFYDGPI